MTSGNTKITICRVTRTMLQYSLLWPADGTELDPGLRYSFKLLGFFLITGLMTASATVHLILEIKKANGISNEDIAFVIAAYGTYYMIISYLKKQRQLAFLLQDLSNFENFGTPPNFEKRNRQLNVCVKILIAYTVLATAFYSGIRIFEKSTCKEINLQRGMSASHCGLLVPVWIPFEIDYFPMFHLWVVIICISAHTLIKMVTHISVNALEIAQYIILKVNHLKIMILECFENEDYEESRAKMKKCISYHIEILHLAARLDNTFFNSMFGHFLITGLICACLEKQLVSGENVLAGTLHIIGWIIALFVGCIGGQKFADASEILPKALWDSNWYQADLRLQKDLLFMLARSQEEFRISAGPFGVLGYPLFVSVIKTSYSILCVLTS